MHCRISRQYFLMVFSGMGYFAAKSRSVPEDISSVTNTTFSVSLFTQPP
jgi:hypothetical protein